ncbi:hypothetical protein HYZ99_01290 [Candidatus Peregrinibacteria bacterium]|nr:hypothetical protein [Candidatus Peregrinibacteria bacterium]
MDLFLLLGIVGMSAILIAFLMQQRHKWTGDDLIYDFVNFVGSALLVIYALSGKAWPFVVLNTIWGGYSLKDVIMKVSAPKVRHVRKA